MRRMRGLTLLLLAPLAVASCAKPAKSPTPPKAQYDTRLPMDELMGHVIDPAAFAYWKGAGTEVTGAGERDLSPTTNEGWEALESGAAVLIEAGNLLQLPGRPRAPEADWNRYARELSARAVVAKAAAGKRDKRGVFDAGAAIYQVCTACHKQYVIDPQLAAHGPAEGLPLPPWPKR